MRKSFYAVLIAAIADIRVNGSEGQDRMAMWIYLLYQASRDHFTPEQDLLRQINSALRATYSRIMDHDRVLKYHHGLAVEQIKEIEWMLINERGRRAAITLQLIKTSHQQSIETMMRKFEGWASSIPPAGSISEPVADIAKRINILSSPLSDRIIINDQAEKLVMSINQIIATEHHAIAAIWHSRWRDPGYKYRKDHKERDLNIFLVRNSWAIRDGSISTHEATYTDEITQPKQEINCKCHYSFLYRIDQLPSRMLTKRGKMFLNSVS